MKTLHAESAAKIQCGVARKCDFERLSVDDIKAIKSDDSVMHFRFVERGTTVDTSDAENMTVVHTPTSEHVDSMGDVIFSRGADMIRLRGNSIMPLFYGHNPDPVPLGKVLKAKQSKYEDGVRCIESTSQFYEQSLYKDAEAGKKVASIRELVLRGDMPGVSIGFVPKSYRWPAEEEREALGMPTYGMIFEEWEWLELSVTPIPANNRALQRKSNERLRSVLRTLVAEGKMTEAEAAALGSDLSAGDDTFLRRARELSKSVVSVGESTWIKSAREPKEAPATTDPNAPMLMDVSSAIEAIQEAGLKAIASIKAETAAAIRREISPVVREILEPLEAGIEEAAERIERANALLETKTADSKRAEVSREVAPNGAPATTAVSTGTSRDNPTNPAQGEQRDALSLGLEALIGATDTANAHRRSEAEGVQG